MPNIAFSKLVKIDSQSLEFNFRKLPGDQMNFHGDVTDIKGNRIQFTIYKDAHDKWHATGNPLPFWIGNHEALIGSTIDETVAATVQKAFKGH